MKKVVRILLFLVFAGIFLLSAYNVGDYYFARYQSEKMQDTLIQQAVTVIPPQLPVPEEEEEETLPVERAPIAVDFETLAEQNPDIIGWIYLENTCIHYPIMQSKDNDYYLHRLFDKSWSWPGTPFADYRLKGDFTDFQTIVYGHNMKNGTMFQQITEYKQQDFYDRHPTALLMTPEGNYQIEWIAGYVTDLNSDAWKIEFASDEEFSLWLENAMTRSTFLSTTEPDARDKLITLSTCSYEYADARYVLVGILK